MPNSTSRRGFDDCDAALRAEADALLSSGLRDALAAYGALHVVGSHALRLMTWRDLDLHVVPERVEAGKFFELGKTIAGLLTPRRMHFRDSKWYLSTTHRSIMVDDMGIS